MLFGSIKDFDLYTGIARELVGNLVEQEILYYKLSIEDTSVNIYGESQQKMFWTPVKLNCLITRGDQVITDDEFGPDLTRDASFAFIRQDLVDTDVLPEVGDIVLWHENYYEVGTVRENQLFLGRDKGYSLTSYGSRFGSSVSIIVDCHLTRPEKLGITPQR